VPREACETAGRDLRVIHFRGKGIGGNATQIISRIRMRTQIDGKALNLDRLNWYSIRHTIAHWLRDYVSKGYISASPNSRVG